METPFFFAMPALARNNKRFRLPGPSLLRPRGAGCLRRRSAAGKLIGPQLVVTAVGAATFASIAAIDLFVVPTIGFKLLYVFVIVRLNRRDLVRINVTAHPIAEWVARQITVEFPWNEAPRYMIRDRDCIYGAVVTRRLRAMGIRDKPIAPVSPWQNGFVERLIGSIRRTTSLFWARHIYARF